jgi:hypothetical protein
LEEGEAVDYLASGAMEEPRKQTPSPRPCRPERGNRRLADFLSLLRSLIVWHLPPTAYAVDFILAPLRGCPHVSLFVAEGFDGIEEVNRALVGGFVVMSERG